MPCKDELQKQLELWKEFRQFQTRTRNFYLPRHRSQEYQNLVQESQVNGGSLWNIQLRQAQHQQNRLEDRNDFWAFCYRKFKKYKKEADAVEQNLLHWKKESEDDETQLTNVIDDPEIIYKRFRGIVDWKEEITKSNLKVESAEKVLQAANGIRQREDLPFLRERKGNSVK